MVRTTGTAGGTATGATADGTKSKVVGGVFAAGALVSVLGAIAAVALADVFSVFPGALEAFGTAMALVLLLSAGLSGAVAYGIWTFTGWGWFTGIALSASSALMVLYTALVGPTSPAVLATFAASAFCVWALWDERDAFDR